MMVFSEKLSVGQQRTLSEFFGNAGVAWLSAGVIVPFFTGRTLANFITSIAWGTLFAIGFLIIALVVTKGVKS